MLSLAAQLHLSGSNCSGGHPQSSAGVDDGVGGGGSRRFYSQITSYLFISSLTKDQKKMLQTHLRGSCGCDLSRSGLSW